VRRDEREAEGQRCEQRGKREMDARHGPQSPPNPARDGFRQDDGLDRAGRRCERDTDPEGRRDL
jgi:hypothetical protein